MSLPFSPPSARRVGALPLGIRSWYFRTGVTDVLTLLVKPKTHGKAVVYTTFEGQRNRPHAPDATHSDDVEAWPPRLNQQSLSWPCFGDLSDDCKPKNLH
jgi:hypothetical protein